MSTKQDKLIAEQTTYLDMVTAEKPYRHVTTSDRVNARAELVKLREHIIRLERCAALVPILLQLMDDLYQSSETEQGGRA